MHGRLIVGVKYVEKDAKGEIPAKDRKMETTVFQCLRVGCESETFWWYYLQNVFKQILAACPHAIAIAGPWLNPTTNVDDHVWECRNGI